MSELVGPNLYLLFFIDEETESREGQGQIQDFKVRQNQLLPFSEPQVQVRPGALERYID